MHSYYIFKGILFPQVFPHVFPQAPDIVVENYRCTLESAYVGDCGKLYDPWAFIFVTARSR